jgi:hypothetical protein
MHVQMAKLARDQPPASHNAAVLQKPMLDANRVMLDLTFDLPGSRH